MIPISIDISAIAEVLRQKQIELIQAQPVILRALAEDFRIKWADNASKELKQTRNIYIQAIKIGEPKGDTITLTLPQDAETPDKTPAWLPHAIETGLQPFDMKPGLLKKGKVSKEGNLYFTVPFRHATPGTSTMPVIGESAVFVSRQLPKAIHKLAKKLDYPSAGKDAQTRLTANMLPEQFKVLQKRATVGNFPEYTHKSPIYENLTQTGSKGHSQYMTFRIVSDNSDDSSWIHSGIRAHDFAGKTVREYNPTNIVKEIKRQILAQ